MLKAGNNEYWIVRLDDRREREIIKTGSSFLIDKRFHRMGYAGTSLFVKNTGDEKNFGMVTYRVEFIQHIEL